MFFDLGISFTNDSVNLYSLLFPLTELSTKLHCFNTLKLWLNLLCSTFNSLASCPTLNMFNEMAFVAKNFPNISPQLIFNMATRNGAIALGRNDMGTMAKGNLAKLIYVHVEENKSEDVMRRILAGENMNIKRVDAEFSPTQ